MAKGLFQVMWVISKPIWVLLPELSDSAACANDDLKDDESTKEPFIISSFSIVHLISKVKCHVNQFYPLSTHQEWG